MTDILEDALEEQAIQFIHEFEMADEETNRFAKDRLIDPQADEREKQKLADQLNAALGTDERRK